MDNNPNTTAIATLLQLVQAVNALNITVGKVFPQTIGTSGTATGGASISLPAHVVGYLALINPATGTEIKVPYYSP